MEFKGLNHIMTLLFITRNPVTIYTSTHTHDFYEYYFKYQLSSALN